MIEDLLLKRKVENIHFTAQKSVPGLSEQSHGIRLDAYVTEDIGNNKDSGNNIKVYDVEPEKNNSKRSSLPRRSRYYGDLIDAQLLNTGVDYEKLPELVTIFILPFDPFGENAMYYEAGTIVKTHPQVMYNDGIRRIYLYVNGELQDNATDDDRQLQILLKYINDSTTENATDELTKRLDSIVKSTKAKKDIGIRYMKSWERERELKEEGREEMREEMQEKLDSAEERAVNAEEARKAAEERAESAEKRAEAAEKRLAEHGLL